MMLHDLLFKLEKQAIAMDNADEDMVEKAQHYGIKPGNVRRIGENLRIKRGD